MIFNINVIILTVFIAASVAQSEIIAVFKRPHRVLNKCNKQGGKQICKGNLMFRIKMAAQIAKIAAQIAQIAAQEHQKRTRRHKRRHFKIDILNHKFPNVYKINTHNLFW